MTKQLSSFLEILSSCSKNQPDYDFLFKPFSTKDDNLYYCCEFLTTPLMLLGSLGLLAIVFPISYFAKIYYVARVLPYLSIKHVSEAEDEQCKSDLENALLLYDIDNELLKLNLTLLLRTALLPISLISRCFYTCVKINQESNADNAGKNVFTSWGMTIHNNDL